MNNHNNYPASYDDEIDLFELFAALWKRKWIIVGVTVLAISLAVVYLVFTPSVYEAKVSISEPQSVDVVQLNSGKEQLGSYNQNVTPEFAFSLFQTKLASRSLAMKYFKQYIEPVYRGEGSNQSDNFLLDNKFLSSISISNSTGGTSLVATHQNTDPALAAKWLNEYLKFIEQETKKHLIESAIYNKSQAIKEYQQKIVSLRTAYSSSLQDKIVRLQEAFNIAKKLEIKKSHSDNSRDLNSTSEFDEGILYLRGYDALGAEIEVLKSRTVADAFIGRMRPIQEKISYLESIVYDDAFLQVISVDGWAFEPESRVKPKKTLVLVLAGLLGGLFGVFLSLVLWAVEKRRVVEKLI